MLSLVKKLPRLIILSVLIFLGLCLALLIYTLWPNERGSSIKYSIEGRTYSGIIVALPGESFRVNPENGRVYLKIGNSIYKVTETYLKPNTYTYSFYFGSGWTKLRNNEYFVLPVYRDALTSEGVANIENIVRKDQITQKHAGRIVNFLYRKIIRPENEFVKNINTNLLVWKTIAPETISVRNWAKPVVSDNYLFVATEPEGILSAGKETSLIALNNQTGKELWRLEFKTPITYIDPNLDTDLVFIYTYDSKIYAVEKKTGKNVWEAVCARCELHNDPDLEVILAGKEEVEAYDKKTGKKLWQSGNDVLFTDSYTPNKGVLLLKNNNNTTWDLTLIDPLSGQGLWKKNVVVPYGGNIRKNGDLILFLGKDINAIDSKTGTVLWRNKNIGNTNNQGVKIDEDYIYTTNTADHLTTVIKIKTSNGSEVWRKDIPNTGLHSGILSFDENFVVVRSSDGGYYQEDWPINQYVSVINNKTGELVATRKVPPYSDIEADGNFLLIIQKHITTIDMASGKTVWEFKNKAEGDDLRDIEYSLDKNLHKLFVKTSYSVESLDIKTGKSSWKQDVQSNIGGFLNQDESLGFLAFFADQDMIALDPTNGEVKWKVYGISNATEYPKIENDGTIYFKRLERFMWSYEKYSLYKFDIKTKREEFIFETTASSIGSVNVQINPDGLYIFTSDLIFKFKAQ